MERESLVDGHGRLIADLSVSVTDRCNFRCQYCMPAEGLPWLERNEVLSFEELAAGTRCGGAGRGRRDAVQRVNRFAAAPPVR
jgi:pyruvate-formate lyase-activating enzyme